MTAYYNEIDPYAAQWLRNLIAAGHIAPGDVDERSIEDVKPDDLRGYEQCHFFAGVGVWPLALRRAGWPDDRAVWTGSCPCQPFSAAGKGLGVSDERHLWPTFFHLITQCQPDRIYGEQVASKDGLGWLDLVQADLEGAGYASGAVDLCAAGIGAPHIRQRLWFVAERLADALPAGRTQGRPEPGSGQVTRGSAVSRLADTDSRQQQRQSIIQGVERDGQNTGRAESSGEPGPHGDVCGLANTDGRNTSAKREQCSGEQRQQPEDGGILQAERPGPTNGLWRDADWLHCRDGKWRPVEPGTFPLAHGAASRVGRLRAYGNAINAEAAQAFVEATSNAGGQDHAE